MHPNNSMHGKRKPRPCFQMLSTRITNGGFMAILRTKLSRIIFILGILVSFTLIHMGKGGMEFSELFEDFGKNPLLILIYLGLLIVPALIASILIPWTIKWVKSGA